MKIAVLNWPAGLYERFSICAFPNNPASHQARSIIGIKWASFMQMWTAIFLECVLKSSCTVRVK